jgi:hypothetical protein
LIQLVRALASQSIAAHMNDVEIAEEWLFERQRVTEEEKLRDPEDVYVSVRRREAERAGSGTSAAHPVPGWDSPCESTSSEEAWSRLD